MTLLLGIDIGTSSAKAVLFDPETAQTLAVAATNILSINPAPIERNRIRRIGGRRPSPWCAR